MSMILNVTNVSSDIRDNLRILREGLTEYKPVYEGSPFDYPNFDKIRDRLEDLLRITPNDCFASTVEVYPDGALNVFFKRMGADHAHLIGRSRP